tara:strand:+ start:20036 stop:20344 length:309 start_codon:yes stop_codon:yes gene_type:complete
MFVWVRLFIKDVIKFAVTIPKSWFSFRNTSKKLRDVRVFITDNGRVEYFLKEYEALEEEAPRWVKLGILEEFIAHAEDSMKEETAWGSVIAYQTELIKQKKV